MRLIDADKADVDQISCYYGDRAYLDDVQEWLDEQPTIDDVCKVIHARWITYKEPPFIKGCICANCKSNGTGGNYCSNCGAKMDLGDNNAKTQWNA